MDFTEQIASILASSPGVPLPWGAMLCIVLFLFAIGPVVEWKQAHPLFRAAMVTSLGAVVLAIGYYGLADMSANLQKHQNEAAAAASSLVRGEAGFVADGREVLVVRRGGALNAHSPQESLMADVMFRCGPAERRRIEVLLADLARLEKAQ